MSQSARIMKIDDIGIENIELDLKSRDDVPYLLRGLKHLYTDPSLRDQLFTLLEKELVPDVNDQLYHPRLQLWRTLVIAVMKGGLDCSFGYIHDMVNNHSSIREFLGHSNFFDRPRFTYEWVVDHVNQVRPEVLVAVSQMVIESGHAVSKRLPWKILANSV